MTKRPIRLRSRIGLLVAITLAHLFVIPAPAGLNTPAQPPTDGDVLATIRDFAQTKDARQWLSVNRLRLTPEFLAAVQNLSDRAVAQGNQSGDTRALHFAVTAKLLAANALLEQGDQSNALRSFIGATDVKFMLANSSEAYERVWKSASDSAEKAAGIGAAELGFRARVIAADACYQASILKDLDVKTRQEWERNGLAELSRAAKLVGSNHNRVWLERFVSLSGAVLGDARSHPGYGGDEGQKAMALKQLITTMETAVPLDFAFQILPNKDWQSDARIASLLAGLSYDHGDASMGASRLRYAMRVARLHGDTDLLASVMSQLYEAEKRRSSDSEWLSSLRVEVRDATLPLRAGYASRGGRLWAAARTDELLGQLTRDELSAGAKVDDVFNDIEMLKARLLLDQVTLHSRPLRSADTINAAAEIERELLAFPSCSRSHDDLFTRELLLLSRMPLATRFTQQEDGERVRKLEEIYHREGAGFGGGASTPSLASVQAVLRPDEAIVEYFIPYYELHPAIDLWIIVITNSRTVVTHVPLDRFLPKGDMIGSIAVDGCPPLDASPLGDAVAALRVALQTTDEKKADRLLRLFNQMLIKPVLDSGFDPTKFRHWIIVPHGPLHYVPFAALTDKSGEFLIQQVALSISPSTSVWMRKQATKRVPPSSVAGVFAPVLDNPAFQALPSSARETTAIRARFPASEQLLFSGPDATKRQLLEIALKADILHLSTHGDFPELYAMDRHAIMLSKDGADEGRLTAAEIRTFDLSHTALVVLVICNGGLYNVGPSDEPYGLVPAFLAAGATNVLGTLWPIEDEFGRKFVARFYENFSGEGAAQALRKAMLAFIGDGELIRRWSGLVLVGPGR